MKGIVWGKTLDKANEKLAEIVEKYLQPDYLKVSLGMIASCRGELVEAPLEADVVFDDTFAVDTAVATADEEVKLPEIVRSWELEKLVKLVNS